MEEIWKDIKGYENWYQISSFGRVRSLDRTVYFKNGKSKRDYIGKILKQKYHNGYAMVNLNMNKDLKVLYVHRLVAEHFLENPNNLPVVNHIDGIKSNNNVLNLEWCTYSENNIHAVNTGLRHDNIDGLIKYTNSLKKKIIAIKDNKFITCQNCSKDMAKFLLLHGYINNSSIETIARACRKCANSGNTYHGINFQFI